mgnify:CR=1 FL=1
MHIESHIAYGVESGVNLVHNVEWRGAEGVSREQQGQWCNRFLSSTQIADVAETLMGGHGTKPNSLWPRRLRTV